jgi:hypothetical protein
LQDSHWEEITNDIFDLKLLGRDWQHMADSDEDDNGGDDIGGTRVNPRARIDIDW